MWNDSLFPSKVGNLTVFNSLDILLSCCSIWYCFLYFGAFLLQNHKSGITTVFRVPASIPLFTLSIIIELVVQFAGSQHLTGEPGDQLDTTSTALSTLAPCMLLSS